MVVCSTLEYTRMYYHVLRYTTIKFKARHVDAESEDSGLETTHKEVYDIVLKLMQWITIIYYIILYIKIHYDVPFNCPVFNTHPYVIPFRHLLSWEVTSCLSLTGYVFTAGADEQTCQQEACSNFPFVCQISW